MIHYLSTFVLLKIYFKQNYAVKTNMLSFLLKHSTQYDWSCVILALTPEQRKIKTGKVKLLERTHLCKTPWTNSYL